MKSEKFNFGKIVYEWHSHLESFSLLVANIRRGSIPVSTVLRKSVRFFIINIFLVKNFKLSKLISRKWFGQSVNISSEWLRNPGKRTLLPGEHAPRPLLLSRKSVSIYSRSAPEYKVLGNICFFMQTATVKTRV